MLKTSNHAGVEGFIVKNIRKQVEISLQVDSDSAFDMNLVLRSPHIVFDLLISTGGIHRSSVLQPGNANTWSVGEELVSLLELLLCLPHGAKTDLLNSMDR